MREGVLHGLETTGVVYHQLSTLIRDECVLRSKKKMAAPRIARDDPFHRAKRILFHALVIAIDEVAKRYEPVKRIADDAKLEVILPHQRMQVRLNLCTSNMAMFQRSDRGKRERLFDKQATLLPVARIQIRPQGFADRMRARFGNGHKYEFESVRNDQDVTVCVSVELPPRGRPQSLLLRVAARHRRDLSCTSCLPQSRRRRQSILRRARRLRFAPRG